MRSTRFSFTVPKPAIAAAATAAALLCTSLPAQAAVSVMIAQVSPSSSPQAVCIGGTATFTATIGGSATGSYSESQSNPGSAYASLSPSTTQTGLIKGQAVTYTLTGLTATSSAQTVTISASGNGPPSPGTDQFTVSTNGPLGNPSKTTLTFDGTLTNGSGTNGQSFAIHDDPGRTITATIASGSVATFNDGTTQKAVIASNGSANFTVVPVGSTSQTAGAGGQQSTAISFSDGSPYNCQLNSAVTVNVIPGSVAISQPTTGTLTFAGPSAALQSIQGTDFNYTGTLTAVLGSCSPDCGIATITGPTAGPGAGNTFTYNVTPKKLGNGVVTVTGSGTAQTVKVLVNGASISAVGGSPVKFNSDGTNTGINGPVSSNVTSTPITVTGALETSGSGTGSIYVVPPLSDISTGSGTLLISSLGYNCTLTGTGSNQGVQSLVTGSSYISLQKGMQSGPCMQFGANQYSNLSFNLNFALDMNAANSLPAGTYSSNNGFTLYISAT